MEQFFKKENNLEKPPVLYHGSPDKNIQEFEPRQTTFNHSEKGDFVIATPVFANALPYLFSGYIDGKKILWNSGSFGEGDIYVVLPVSKEIFLQNDHGGAIYEISPESFNSNEQRKEYEWYSTEPVKPLKSIVFDSVYDEWQKNNIKSYFLTEEQFLKFRSIETGKQKKEFLENL